MADDKKSGGKGRMDFPVVVVCPLSKKCLGDFKFAVDGLNRLGLKQGVDYETYGAPASFADSKFYDYPIVNVRWNHKKLEAGKYSGRAEIEGLFDSVQGRAA